MENNKQDKSFTYYFNDMQRKIESLEKYPDNSVADTATLLKNNLKELNKGFKGIKSMIAFTTALAIIFFLFIGFLLSNNRISKHIISGGLAGTKDSILGLSSENEVLSYRTYEGKIVTYEELTKSNDSLELRNSQIQSDLDLTKLKFQELNNKIEILKVESVQNKKLNNSRDELDQEIRSKFTKNYNKQIDSAFILLKAFRKDMKYDKKTDSWNVKIN